MKTEEENGNISLTLPKSLIFDFRTTVKKSGYTQKFLITKIMQEIIKELKAGDINSNGGDDEEKRSL